MPRKRKRNATMISPCRGRGYKKSALLTEREPRQDYADETKAARHPSSLQFRRNRRSLQIFVYLQTWVLLKIQISLSSQICLILFLFLKFLTLCCDLGFAIASDSIPLAHSTLQI